MTPWLAKRLDKRRDRDLAMASLISAMYCRRNAIMRPERADFWNDEALRYLDQANTYLAKSKT